MYTRLVHPMPDWGVVQDIELRRTKFVMGIDQIATATVNVDGAQLAQ